LCPQTPGNHFDSRIFIRCSSFWWCSKDSRFLVIYGVRRQDFWAIAPLCDAFQVPKPLSPQLQPFGKFDDCLGELTFEVKQFSALAVRRGRSAGRWRTVRELCVRRVFIVFLRVFAFDLVWFLVFVAAGSRTVRASIADGPGPTRTVRPFFADGPFFSSHFCWFCVLYRTVRGVGPDSPQCWCGRSAAAGRTVREASADGPPLLAGRSARASVLCFLVRFFPSFLVLPRVLQGIVLRTRG
jgi:hypothetical protein